MRPAAPWVLLVVTLCGACASTTPAQRATAILKLLDEECLDADPAALAALMRQGETTYRRDAPTPAPVGAKRPGQRGYGELTTPQKRYAWALVDHTDAEEGRVVSLTCKYSGNNLDEALLVRGLLARLNPQHQFIDKIRGRTESNHFTKWLVDDRGRRAQVHTYGSFGEDGVNHSLSTQVELALPIGDFGTMRAYLNAWPDEPGAAERLVHTRARFLEEENNWSQKRHEEERRQAEVWSQRENERSAFLARAIAGGLTQAAGALQRQAVVEQQQRDMAMRPYVGGGVLSGGVSGGMSGTPTRVPGTAAATTGVPAKAVCKWGQARGCENGFKVGVVEYDCTDARSKSQAEAAYQRQLEQCNPKKKDDGPSLVECENKRLACRKKCEDRAERCVAPPAPPEAPTGPAPAATTNFWKDIVANAATSSSELGWMPSQDLALDVAKTRARNAATAECSGAFGPNVAGRIREDFVPVNEGCDSKSEMGSTVWNCRVGIKVQCDGPQANPEYARYEERVRQAGLAANAHRVKQAAFESCQKQSAERVERCERACGACP